MAIPLKKRLTAFIFSGTKKKENVYRFGSVKRGDPQQKLKMIFDDTGRLRWAVPVTFVIAFAVGIAGGFFFF